MKNKYEATIHFLKQEHELADARVGFAFILMLFTFSYYARFHHLIIFSPKYISPHFNLKRVLAFKEKKMEDFLSPAVIRDDCRVRAACEPVKESSGRC